MQETLRAESGEAAMASALEAKEGLSRNDIACRLAELFDDIIDYWQPASDGGD